MSNSWNKLFLGELMIFIFKCIVLFFLIRWITKKDKKQNIVIRIEGHDPKPKFRIIKGEKND